MNHKQGFLKKNLKKVRKAKALPLIAYIAISIIITPTAFAQVKTAFLSSPIKIENPVILITISLFVLGLINCLFQVFYKKQKEDLFTLLALISAVCWSLAGPIFIPILIFAIFKRAQSTLEWESFFPQTKRTHKTFTLIALFPLIGFLGLLSSNSLVTKAIIWLPSLIMSGFTFFWVLKKRLKLNAKSTPFALFTAFIPLGFFQTNKEGALVFTLIIIIIELYEIARDLNDKTINEKRLSNVQDEMATQLMIEGINLSTSINQLNYILDNMRQSFFIVDEGMIINNPISQFSEELFGQKIIGKNIFETIFQEIKEGSEEHALISFCWETIFDADETQWIMINNQFPSKVNISSKAGSGKKILKIAYYPIWNEQNLLSNMMMVIDDITEMEFLENKMRQEKEISNRRITILHELTSNKRSTLKPFFHQLDENLKEALKWSKLMREDIKRKKNNLQSMEALFKFLHIIKGSSRQFSFTFISRKTHDIETILSQINELIKKSELDDDERYKNTSIKTDYLLKEMDQLVGIINGYIKIGKTLLNLDFPEDSETIRHIHENLKNFDVFIFKLFQGQKFSLSTNEEIIEAIKIKRKNPAKLKNSILRLQNSCSLIESYSIVLNEEDISKSAHKINYFLETFSLNPDTPEIESERENQNIIQNFIEPLNQLRIEGIKLYSSSKTFHKETFKISSKDIWAKAILYVYYETKNIMKKDKVHLPSLSKNITRIKALFKANHFEYATGVIKIIESLLIEGDSKHSFKEMKFSLIKLWKFFALLFRFDLDHSVWDEENDEFFDSKRFLRNEYHTDYSLFQIFLLNIDDDKQIAYDIFKTTMKSLMGLDEKEVNDLFLPDKSFLDYYVELGKKLTDRFNSTSLQNFKSDFLIKRDFSIFQQLEDHLSNQKFSWINYHQSLDIYKLFRAYFNISKVREKFRRPDTLDVLSKNFEESKKYLKRTFQDLPEEQRATIDIAFEKLLGLPVKFSLSKFYNLVSDISQSLNKKIQLKISGDEGSLLPDDFNQLQDALIHILRNSMDHGIESPSERLERGKKEMGTIEISCEESKTGSLRIVVKDDGGGINLKKVEERAIRNNICTQKELDIMSQKEKIDLIFLPNFSTKDTVSEISGRGFGMDVVKSTLEKIGANLEVATQEEEGTTFVIDITPKKKI